MTINMSPASSISISLEVDPPRFPPHRNKRTQSPSISVRAVSHATAPITIFTWPTIFNLALAQRRDNFECFDITADAPVRVNLTKGPKRRGFSRERGGHDDRFFCTLLPETPVVFVDSFKVANRVLPDHDETSVLQSGHRYTYAVREGEAMTWWGWGTKDEVMAPSDQPEALGEPSGGPIDLQPIAVEFEVE
ncbi:uncharacterized protein KD926_010877 [Aspergillus affinis]|uniref:uncharacterized protein n=1 Tax=Aspergillus affinis TaxID=1070780 RepID=UPI0022FEB884|nr:uncharacterized protein KD926_010877 [Aspergillus affinis]KAI9038341.1 hypothetical protein KD926_010877 [Aspergillus affinis]